MIIIITILNDHHYHSVRDLGFVAHFGLSITIQQSNGRSEFLIPDDWSGL
jgi:hypothetical protein